MKNWGLDYAIHSLREKRTVSDFLSVSFLNFKSALGRLDIST